MTITNIIECDFCHKAVNPPENVGWVSLMVTGPDGIQFVNCYGHACIECSKDFKRKIDAARRLQ